MNTLALKTRAYLFDREVAPFGDLSLPLSPDVKSFPKQDKKHCL